MQLVPELNPCTADRCVILHHLNPKPEPPAYCFSLPGVQNCIVLIRKGTFKEGSEVMCDSGIGGKERAVCVGFGRGEVRW